jgi:hypothetical protein
MSERRTAKARPEAAFDIAREDGAPSLIGYYSKPHPPISPEPAPRWRDWMNEAEERWPNRCLPLLMANEAGWVFRNPSTFNATWSGGPHPDELTIEYEDENVSTPPPAESHFGYGIITWHVPYLFRTSPGLNLLARGPANWPKDGISALEGIVETDWSFATFTMNWKVTRVGEPVVFEAGEPFCMVVPQPRGLLEAFRPELKLFAEDRETREGYEAWARGRHDVLVQKFLSQYSKDFDEERLMWQKHYFKGQTPEGGAAPEHQTMQRLAPFTDEEQPTP